MNCSPTFRRIFPPETLPLARAMDKGEKGVFFANMLKKRPSTVSISLRLSGHVFAAFNCSSSRPLVIIRPSSFNRSGFLILQLYPCVMVVWTIFRENTVVTNSGSCSNLPS